MVRFNASHEIVGAVSARTAICVLLGPPCSGKTTLGDGLAEATGLPHILASAELRGIDQSCVIENIDELQVETIVKRVTKPDCARGFILDNFPRSAVQAQALEDALQRHFGRGVSCVLDLEVPMKVLESRAASRLVYRSSGLPAQLHDDQCSEELDVEEENDRHSPSVKLVVPPDVARDVEVHQEALLRRSDDAPERLQKRVERYGSSIAELRSFYGSERCVVLDAAGKKQHVLSQSVRAINKHSICNSKALLEIQSPKAYLTGVQSSLCLGRERLELAKEMLQSFSTDVASDSKWVTKTSTEPCGCSRVTKTYMGRSPPDLQTCKASAREIQDLVAECKQKLWAAREIYMRRQYGDVSPWFSWLLICCTVTPETTQLESSCDELSSKAWSLQNQLTIQTTKTLTQTTCSYCSLHLPPPVLLPGSP